MDPREHLIDLVTAASDHAEAIGDEHTAFLLAGVLIALIEGTESKLARDCTEVIAGNCGRDFSLRN